MALLARLWGNDLKIKGKNVMYFPFEIRFDVRLVSHSNISLLLHEYCYSDFCLTKAIMQWSEIQRIPT